MCNCRFENRFIDDRINVGLNEYLTIYRMAGFALLGQTTSLTASENSLAAVIGIAAVYSSYSPSAALTNGPLTVPASSTSGGNGAYAHYEDFVFPANSFNSNNCRIDVLFRAQAAT
jgi:hypothetical protein